MDAEGKRDSNVAKLKETLVVLTDFVFLHERKFLRKFTDGGVELVSFHLGARTCSFTYLKRKSLQEAQGVVLYDEFMEWSFVFAKEVVKRQNRSGSGGSND
jgi:hypothetical protein